MVAEAQSHRELLVKHGLAENLLDNLVQALDQFDAAVDQALEGRQAHVRASAELRAVATEVVEIVRVMDGLNRYRFGNDPALLAAWESASNVAENGRPAGKPAPEGQTTGTGGEVRPAA